MSGEISFLIKGNAGQLKSELGIASAAVKDFGEKSEKFLQKGEMSAKQLAFATRGLPAQFTDIATSLQAGQNPLTVFLQQGGQLKDMFGGIGPATKAMGGYLMGLINPYTVAAAAAAALGYAWYKGAAEAGEYNKALILSGNTAGATFLQMQEQARAIAASSSASTGAAAEAMTQFVRNGNMAADKIQGFASTAVSMQHLTGIAVADTVKQFAELGKSPVEASLKLNETTGYLTAGVYEQIKALMDQGRTLEAGALAQQTYADAMNSRMPQLEDNLLRIEKWWNAISKSAKDAWSSMISASDPATMLRARLATLQGSDKFANGSYMGGSAVSSEIAALQEKIKYYDHIAASNKDLAAFQAAQNKQLQASVALSKEADQYASKQVQMQRAIAKAQENFEGSGKSAADLANYSQAVVGIQDRFKEAKKAKEALTDAAKGLALYNDLMAVGSGLSANFAEKQTLLSAKFGKDGNMDEYRAGLTALISQHPYMVDGLKAEADALAAIEKSRDKALLTHATELESLGEKSQKIEDEVAMYGLSKDAIEALTTARMLDRIEVLKGFDNAGEEIARIEQTIAARQRLARAATALDVKDVNAKAAADMLKEQKKAAEESGKYWEDALMRAFESGKGFFESLWDTIKNTLKTTVLKVLIQGVMGGVTGMAVSSAMAGPSGSGALGTLGSATGLYNTASTLSGAYNVATGSAALSTLYANATATGLDGLLATNAAFGTAAEASTGLAGAVGSVSTALAAIPVWGWAAMGVMALIGSGVFDGGGGPKTESGSGIGLGGNQASLGGGAADYVKGLEAGYASTADQLGISGAMKAGAFTSVDTQGDSLTQLQVVAAVDGKTVYDRNKLMGGTENVGRSPDELKAALGLEAARAVFAALQASTLPNYLAGVFDGLSAGAMTQDQISAAVATAQSFKTLHDQLQALPFQNLTDLSFKAAAGLVAAAGGMDKLGANLTTYYTAFYSAEEQRAQTVKNINASVAAAGVSGFDAASASRAAYRALVDGQDLSTASGQKAYAALIGVAGAFDQLTPAIDSTAAAASAAKQAADDAKAAIKAAEDAAAALTKTNQALQDQLAILTGQQTDLTIAMRDAGATSTAVLLAQVDAQTRLNEATAQAAADARDLKAALTSAGSGLSAFIASLNSSSGVTASLSQTRASYNADLALAQAGNVDASNRLPASGRAYLDAQNVLAASSVDMQRASALMASQLSALPASKSYEQQMLDAIAATTQAVGDLNGKLVTELTVSARSEIVKAISVVGTSTMSDELKRLALLDTATIGHTIDLIAGMDVSNEFKKLALDKAADFARIINITAGSDITAEQKMLALGTVTSDFNRTINALGGTLTDEQKLLLNGQVDYSKTVQINTVVSSSANAAPAITPQDPSGSTYTLKTWDGTNPLLVASDGSSIGWYASMAKASIASVFSADMASSYPAGTAMYAAMAAYGHDISLPGFAVGTNSVPFDMAANIHKDERIMPAADNRELMARLRSPQQNNGALVDEIRRLRESNDRLEARLQAIESNTGATAVHTANTADSTRRMDAQGVLVYTDPAEPIATKAAA